MLRRKDDEAAKQQHDGQTAINAAAVDEVRHLRPRPGQAVPALQERAVHGERVCVVDGRRKEHERQAEQRIGEKTLPQHLEPAHAVERVIAVDFFAQLRRHDAEGGQQTREQAPRQIPPVRAVPQAGADKDDDDV